MLQLQNNRVDGVGLAAAAGAQQGGHDGVCGHYCCRKLVKCIDWMMESVAGT